MNYNFHYSAIVLVLLITACTKKENRVPKDLRHLMGFKDAHWIVDSIRQTGTTGSQNTPYTALEVNPFIFEFHSASEQVVIVKLDNQGKSIDRAPCSFNVIDNDQEAQIAYSYSAPNRYDVIKSEKNKQHWRMTKTKNPGLIYTEDYYMHRKDPI